MNGKDGSLKLFEKGGLNARLNRQLARGGGQRAVKGRGAPRRELTRITPLTGTELFLGRFSQPGAPAIIEANGYPKPMRDKLGRDYFVYRGLDRRAAFR